MSVTNNNYYIPNLKINGSAVKTNLPANHSYLSFIIFNLFTNTFARMRAPGFKEGILASEVFFRREINI